MSTNPNPGPPEVTVRACRVDEIPDGGAVTVTAAGRRVAVFRVHGRLVAFDGTCPHAGGPIGEGFVRSGTVTCPWHWWRFRLDTGERIGAPWVRLRRYQTSVDGDEVFVHLPPAPAEVPLRERLLAAARSWQERQRAEGAGRPA